MPKKILPNAWTARQTMTLSELDKAKGSPLPILGGQSKMLSGG